ncbi:TniQ family protein [Natranaerobius thermophilus]|uniref:TniQ family protein n=1 Tax=Natranaerobius thermophilus TaxID=375929 RepID=UPI000166891F|nr:TniQ family protein [Natranaerobius thermophilus]
MEDEEIKIPKRSYLNNLQPIGVGTEKVESLTSYIARVAESHSLYTGKLVALLLLPHMNKEKQLSQFSGGFQFKNSFNNTSYDSNFYNINGLTITAEEYVTIMQDFTLRCDLSFLTMLKYSEVIVNYKLLSSKFRWCPYCYEEMAVSKNKEIYNPLLWHFNDLNICKVHDNYLEDTCPYCFNKMFAFTNKFKPGFCSICGNWLGREHVARCVDDLGWQYFISESLSEFVRQSSNVENLPKQDIFINNLKKIVKQAGSINLLANYIEIPKNTVGTWVNKNNFPSFNSILKLCYIWT